MFNNQRRVFNAENNPNHIRAGRLRRSSHDPHLRNINGDFQSFSEDDNENLLSHNNNNR